MPLISVLTRRQTPAKRHPRLAANTTVSLFRRYQFQNPIYDRVVSAARDSVVIGISTTGLTTFDDNEYVREALQAGACGYLLKDLPASDLAHAIRAAHRGVHQFDPQISEKLVAAFQAVNSSATPSENIDLTTREIEVLRLLAQGASNREISEKLVISQGTVKNHISSILGRLGLRDRTQAALLPVKKDYSSVKAAMTNPYKYRLNQAKVAANMVVVY
jgi:DNA-binding NarL/FixJ family response regulator